MAWHWVSDRLQRINKTGLINWKQYAWKIESNMHGRQKGPALEHVLQLRSGRWAKNKHEARVRGEDAGRLTDDRTTAGAADGPWGRLGLHVRWRSLAMADVISPGPCSPRHGDTPCGVGFHRQRHGAAKLSGREACGGALLLAGCDGLIRRRYGAATRTRRGSRPCRSRVVCEWVRARGVLGHVGEKQGQRAVAAFSTSPLQPERKWYLTANVLVPIWAGLVDATESLFVSTRWNGMPAAVREVCSVLALHVFAPSTIKEAYLWTSSTHLRLGGSREKNIILF
jgi:hypothetical protein